MKTPILFYFVLSVLIASGFSTDKNNLIEIPDQQITAPEMTDSVIGNQFNAILYFIEKEIQFYKTAPGLSKTEQDVFFEKFFVAFDIKLETAFSNIKLYAENYQKTNDSSLIESDIINIIEKERYLESMMKHYEYLKSHCTLNAYEKSASTKKIERTLVNGLMALCLPVYNNAIEMKILGLSTNDLYLNTDDILNKGVQEWNTWRAKNPILIPAINNFDFQDKNLEKVNFSSMHFEQYNFKNAILDGADFQNAIISNCDFSNASLNHVNLTGARADRNTKFPKRFNRRAHGLIE